MTEHFGISGIDAWMLWEHGVWGSAWLGEFSWLVWANVIGDALIALAYLVVFGCLLRIATGMRRAAHLKDYLLVFVSLWLFVVACGTTRVLEVTTIWWPDAKLTAFALLISGAIGIATAAYFAWHVPLFLSRLPRIMALLSKTEMERDEANAALLVSEQILAERRRADEEIALAHVRLNHILDSSLEGIVKIDAAWKLVYGNRKAMAMLRDLEIGKDFWECFPALFGTEAERCLRQAMDERVPTEYEIFYEPYEDWFRVSASPTPAGISLFFSVITAQKKLEEELGRQRDLALTEINSVMDSTSEGIYKLSMDWVVTYGNRRAFEMLPDLKIGVNFWETFPGVGPEIEARLRRTMEHREEAEWENYYDPYKEWYAVHVYPTDGGLSVFFIPITRRKKLEQQLETERMLREKRIEALSHMAGGLAHEISNPLAIIHGTASDLQRMASSGETDTMEVLRASASIIHTSDRASRILRGLRGFAREAGKDPMEYASVYDILEQALQMQETRFDRNDVELRMELAPGIPVFLCRETQVGQIVTNLVNNAYDAITQQDCPERWVQVEASCAGGFVQIDVTDSGLGIDEESRKHLMDPFFTTKTRGLGMGVGLSLSRAIATEHGGSLQLCEDTAHTCFRLLLPIEAVETEGELAGVLHGAE